MKREKKRAKLHIVLSALALLVVLIISAYFMTNHKKITGYDISDSQVGNLSASIQTYVACTWSDAAMDVGFGANLDPGTNDINATKNYNLSSNNGTAYNVTVSSISNVNVDITIKGSDLVDGPNAIGITNVSWVSNTTIANGTNLIAGNSHALSTSFDAVNKVGANLDKNNAAYFRFWLDVPNGQVAGDYVGNFTQQCAEAS